MKDIGEGMPLQFFYSENSPSNETRNWEISHIENYIKKHLTSFILLSIINSNIMYLFNVLALSSLILGFLFILK